MFKHFTVWPLGWVSWSHHWESPGYRLSTGRGRTKGWEVSLDLGKYELAWHGAGQPYWKLVGFKRRPSVDWMLDEYDASFNEFAAASLRYHLGYAVTCNEDRREKYEDLIARLTEPKPSFTREELDELRAISAARGGDFIPLDPEDKSRGSRMRKFTERESEIHAAERAREDAWYARNDQARHDFVDIMRRLWS